MTKSQARHEAARLAREGWQEVQIMDSDGLRSVTYGVIAVDPHTGITTGWHWNAGDSYDNSTQVRA